MSASHWDKESIYDEQIAPMMTKVIAICKEHQIPLVAVFQYQDFLTEKTEAGRRSFTGKGTITSAAKAAVEAMRSP